MSGKIYQCDKESEGTPMPLAYKKNQLFPMSADLYFKAAQPIIKTT
jgi:hypothetical protein